MFYIEIEILIFHVSTAFCEQGSDKLRQRLGLWFQTPAIETKRPLAVRYNALRGTAWKSIVWLSVGIQNQMYKLGCPPHPPVFLQLKQGNQAEVPARSERMKLYSLIFLFGFISASPLPQDEDMPPMPVGTHVWFIMQKITTNPKNPKFISPPVPIYQPRE